MISLTQTMTGPSTDHEEPTMANPANRKDPLRSSASRSSSSSAVDVGEAFFKSVSGLRYETEIVPVREGGANDTTFQLVGATKWSNLVLKQGFTGSSDAARVARGVARTGR